MNCVVPGCNSDESNSFLYGFPADDDRLLNEWITRMSFLNFEEIDVNHCKICENHFDTDNLEIKTEKKLLPHSTPSIFLSLPDNPADQLEPNQLACRFCLKPFDNKKEAISLDSTIKKHFKNFTNAEVRNCLLDPSKSIFYQPFLQLKTDNDLPDLSCTVCYNEVMRSSLLKTKILENQKRLLELIDRKLDSYEDFKIKEENESEDEEDDDMYDDFYYNDGNLEVQVQEQDQSEDNNDVTMSPSLLDDDEPLRSRTKSRSDRKKRRLSSTSSPDTEKEKKRSESLKRKYEHAKERVLCQDCGQYFARANIKKHHLRIHVRAPPQFKCDICEKMFFRKDELKNHMKVHSGPRDKLHQCHLCDKKFATKGSLKIHFNIVHLKIGNICCEYFSDNFILHFYLYHPLLLGEFCGKSFMNNTNYQNHLRSTHTLER